MEILLVLGAYLIGSIPSAGLITRWLKRMGIGREGAGGRCSSGVEGSSAGLVSWIAALADSIKGFISIVGAKELLDLGSSYGVFWISMVAFAVFVGHFYPPSFACGGRKGMALPAGLYCSLLPLSLFLSLPCVFLSVYRWRAIRLGLIIAAGSLPAFVLLVHGPDTRFLFSLVTFFMICWIHSDDILSYTKPYQEEKAG